MTKNQANNVVFFDGVCNFCNASVHFIIKRDKNDRFKFAALQSDYAKEKLSNYFQENPSQAESIILLENGHVFTQSTAALRIAKHLKGMYPLLYCCIIIPKFFRNFVYDFIAKNRYKWFGKKKECMIPTPEIKSKFLT